MGFISLLLFSILHLIGNVMLVYEYNDHYKSINVTVWGYILQSIGLSFLVSASLAFYSRARSTLQTEDETKRTAKAMRLLNLVNIAALVCIITGYTSTSFTNAQGEVINPSLPIETKVGAVLYVVLIVTIAGLSLVGLKNASIGEAKLIRLALGVALPLTLIRAAYAVYSTIDGGILMPKNVWVKLVLQYIVEFLALCVYTGLGFMMEKTGVSGSYDLEVGSGASTYKTQQWTPASEQQVQQVPIQYVAQHQ